MVVVVVVVVSVVVLVVVVVEERRYRWKRTMGRQIEGERKEGKQNCERRSNSLGSKTLYCR